MCFEQLRLGNAQPKARQLGPGSDISPRGRGRAHPRRLSSYSKGRGMNAAVASNLQPQLIELL